MKRWLLLLALCPACAGSTPENKVPQARLRTPTVADARLPVTLDAARSVDEDGTIVSYSYLFGDGTPEVTRQESSVQHVFPGPGRFTMRLTVKDNADGTASLTREITLVDNFTPPYCERDAGGCDDEQTCEDDGVCWQE
ncbi:MAG: PKD domain-containing protein [Myxococcota bacterium]